MQLILYPKLSRDSKTALTREKKKWGHPYIYNPRGDLLERLMDETGWTLDEVYNQLQKEREYILKYRQYY
jgi:transposase